MRPLRAAGCCQHGRRGRAVLPGEARIPDYLLCLWIQCTNSAFDYMARQAHKRLSESSQCLQVRLGRCCQHVPATTLPPLELGSHPSPTGPVTRPTSQHSPGKLAGSTPRCGQVCSQQVNHVCVLAAVDSHQWHTRRTCQRGNQAGLAHTRAALKQHRLAQLQAAGAATQQRGTVSTVQ